MRTVCERPVSDLLEEAKQQLSVALECEAGIFEPKHYKFWKTYPNSAGPFRGGLCMRAFWEFEMNAFVIPAVLKDDTQIEIAAVFAGDRFFAICAWNLKASFEEIT